MTLLRWDPFMDLYDLQRDMGRIFSRAFGESPRLVSGTPTRLMPAVDVYASGKDLVIRAEMPGLTEKDVDIQVEGNMLTVRGERHEEHEVAEADYRTREISYGTFERTVQLPEGIDVDKIRATLDKGVLEVTVPRAAELAGARKIPVEAGATRKAILGKAKREAA